MHPSYEPPEGLMLCERCQARAATIHANAVADNRVVRTVNLCEPCSHVPRQVDPAEARALLELEASGRAMPPGWFALAAEELRRRSAYHGEPLPAEVQAFVARHAPPPAT